MQRRSPSTRARRTRGGFSLLELLMALSVLGVLAAIGVAAFPPQGARAYANDLRALIQQARFEAVKRSVPVAVVWSASDGEFQTRRGSDATPCAGATLVARASPVEYRRVTVDPGFVDGEGGVWLPSGQARSCALGPFSPTIATIRDDGASRVVTVTLTGRVTIQ